MTIKIISRPAEHDPARAHERITLTPDDFNEDRYHRLRLIKWWDQPTLARARVLVIGAGALGNEVLKNLALLGVGQILVYDLDTIEDSNLTRSVLFRQSDVGGTKAEVAADEVRAINPDCHIVPVVGDAIHELGLGVVRRADIVLGCLDNVEARFKLNRACFRVGRPFVDAGLDHLNGDVRLYHGEAHPCYECGLSEHDRQNLQKKMSCLKLVRNTGPGGHIPTVPTISSIIGGLQVQLAVRALHDLRVPVGRRMGLYGLSDVWFDTALSISETCGTHQFVEPLQEEELVTLSLSAETCTVDQLFTEIEAVLGAGALFFVDDRDLIVSMRCDACAETRPFFGIMGKTTENEAACPTCGDIRGPETIVEISRDHPFGEQPLARIGIPPGHIISAKSADGERYRAFLLGGDLPKYWKP